MAYAAGETQRLVKSILSTVRCHANYVRTAPVSYVYILIPRAYFRASYELTRIVEGEQRWCMDGEYSTR